MTIDASEIIGLLTLGIHDIGIYFAGHARVQQTARTLVAKLGAAMDASEQGTVFLGVVDGRLVHEGKFLLGSTLVAKRLIAATGHLKSGGFLFRKGVTPDELIALFAICATTRADLADLAESRRLLRDRGVRSIELSALHGTAGWLGDGAADAVDDAHQAAALEVIRSLGGAINAYQRLREAVEMSHSSAGGGHDVDLPSSRSTVEEMLRVMAERTSDVMHLARYPDHASYTVGHSVRVALLAMTVGRHLGFDQRTLVEVGTAGLLHDVGKSRIPHSVLYKRGRLDDEERKVIATHTTLGAQILLATPGSPVLGIAAAFGHHVRHDRQGYPKIASWGVTGRVTALVQVCDVFEALTAVRPYKPALPPRRAYEIMANDAGAFDPSAFAALVGAIGFFPPGSRVRLTSGELAVVREVGRNPALPLVELTHDVRGAAYGPGDRLLVDLAVRDVPEPRNVEEVIHDDVAQTAPAAAEEAPQSHPSEPAPIPAPPKCCHDAANPEHEHAAH